MKIRRLELVGFKSFMEKTVIHFDDGISVIVGPNGCGKSNIVDAIFWVMGDQSAKHLRGKDMEDVIFSGTDQNPASGWAEVSITFSAEDGGVPAQYADYSEITVSRRLYRTGESEYLINKTQCRLKDVSEFFMDTGVGARSYSIIEQGQIGRIVSQKPEERRTLIEEAAGITKYKSRRHEAQLKLAGTEQNILRVDDIVKEIKRQMDSLQRQAKKAEKYKEYKTQIREIELAVLSQEFEGYSSELEGMKTKLTDLKEKKMGTSTEVEKVEAMLQKMKLELMEAEKELHELQESFYQSGRRIQELESQIKLKHKENENWKSHEEKDAKDVLILKDRRDQLEKSKENVARALSELSENSSGIDLDLSSQKSHVESETQKKNILSEKVEKENEELLELLQAKTRHENEGKYLGERIEALEEENENLTSEVETLAESIQKDGTHQSHVCAQKESLQSEISRLGQDLQENEKLSEAQKKSLSEKQAQKEICTEELHIVKSRQASLEEIIQNYEGFDESVKSLLKNQRDKVLGVLADVLEVDPGYEKAFEAVLNNKLEYVLVQDRASALSLISLLKDQKMGHVHFVPAQLALSFTSHAFREAGIHPLWQNVRVGQKIEKFVENLLKDVYVVESLEKAFTLWDQYPGKYTFVTPEGEGINAFGVIRGGKSAKEKNTILSTKSQLRQLETKRKELEEQFEWVQNDVIQCEQTCLALEAQKETLQKTHHAKEVEFAGLEKDLHKVEADLSRLKDDQETLGSEIEEITAKKKHLKEKMQQEKNHKSIVDDKINALERSIETSKKTLNAVSKEIETQQALLNDLNVKKASLSEKQDALSRQLQHTQTNLKELSNEISEKEEAILLSKERQIAIDQEIKEDEKRLEETIQTSETAQAQLSIKKKEFDAQDERFRVLEEGVKKERSLTQAIENEAHELELTTSKLEMSLQHISDQVQERYALSIEDVKDRYLSQEISDEDRQKLTELKEKTQCMGEVNLTAIEEFEDLSQRYGSLTRQREDLIQSMQSIEKTIEKINKISKERFAETFEVVNENFKKIFPLLFHGGHAELSLTDPNDMLETGVEIMARPPGKKLQNMNLLSGGEKALTAVSLVFGIFLMKPSPFCLLDEVDAPLDDANVGRFNEMIRRLTDRSQFIVITHNKKTMSKADVLFGVTMASPGASNLISVKLDTAIELAKSKKSSSLTQPEVQA